MRSKRNSLLFDNGGEKKRRGYGWRRGTDQNVKALGKYGVGLAQHVLGGVRAEDYSGDCDLWLDALDAGMEAKTGSNKDGAKVRTGQLDSHLELARSGFPYSRYWYVFLKYRNAGSRNGNGGNRRLFQEMVRKESDVPDFLGKHTTGLYVLDISVVDAIRAKQEPVTVWSKNGDSYAIRIGWRFFDQLRDAQDEVLRSLDLDPAGYRLLSRRIRTTFEGHDMEFDFMSLLGRDVPKKKAVQLFHLGAAALVAV